MQNTTYHLIIIGLAVAFGIALLIAWRSTRDSHATGYDLGYEDGKRGQLDQVNALHEDLALLRTRQRLVDEEHQQDRDRLIQDCDERIAFYSRRANPFTEEDAVELMKVSGQLLLAANTSERMGATDYQAWALKAAASAKQLAERLRQAIEAATLPAPAISDTSRLDWLARHARIGHIFDEYQIYFSVPEDIHEMLLPREAIDYAMAQERLEAAA